MQNYKFKVKSLKKKDKELRKILKKCYNCKETKIITGFSKKTGFMDGRLGQCRSCCNSKRRKPTKPIAKEGYKFCAKCGEELLLSEFNMRTSKGVKKYFSYCKVCERNQNNNRYSHICNKCGKTYKSGKKDSQICKDCCSKDFTEMGKINLSKLNRTGSNNPMYGIHRYGENNPNYKPYLTEEDREYVRNIPGYKDWIKKVYERDNYTCQCCGDNRGGNLNAHHIYGYSKYKNLRTDMDNGICLCEECHKLYHKQHGFKNNTWEDFKIFLLNKWKETNDSQFISTIENIDLRLKNKETKNA